MIFILRELLKPDAPPGGGAPAPIIELALKLALSLHDRELLFALAKHRGVSVEECASKLVERGLASSETDAILAPLRKEFAESGYTDDELAEQIIEARDEYHSERRKSH